MFVGDNHDVARRIGKSIEYDETMLGAVDDEGAFVVVFGHFAAEHTALDLIDGGDVLVAPRGPEVVHGEKGSRRFASQDGRASSHTCVMFGRSLGKSLPDKELVQFSVVKKRCKRLTLFAAGCYSRKVLRSEFRL